MCKAGRSAGQGKCEWKIWWHSLSVQKEKPLVKNSAWFFNWIHWRKDISLANILFILLPCGFATIFIPDPGGLAGKSLGISYYSHKMCSTLAISLRQSNSTKNISFYHVYVGEYSNSKDYLAFNLLQNIRLSVFLLLVCENIV